MPASKSEAKQLYQQYGKPLETEHQGEYVAISPQGKTVLGATLLEVLKKATEAFGQENYVFKVGERVVGKWL